MNKVTAALWHAIKALIVNRAALCERAGFFRFGEFGKDRQIFLHFLSNKH